MLTTNQQERLNDAARYHHFKQSDFYSVLQAILKDYKVAAISDIEDASADFDGPVRRLHAANGLIAYIEAAIHDKLSQIDEVAAEMGVDLTELRIRSEIDGE